VRIWYKIYERWAEGEYFHSYVYFNYTPDKDLGVCIEAHEEHICSYLNYSDGFRGLRWEAVTGPDKEWAEKEIQKILSNIKSLENYIRVLEEDTL
jgi:hypothetical protein